MRKYEAMFLFDPATAGDWEATQAEVNRILDRAGAKLIICTRWDERRLAYEIRGRKRGLYVLTFFEVDPTKVTDLERDATLSESILRVLVVRRDYYSEEEMKEIAARPAAQIDDRERGGYRGPRDRDDGDGPPRRDFGRGDRPDRDRPRRSSSSDGGYDNSGSRGSSGAGGMAKAGTDSAED